VTKPAAKALMCILREFNLMIIKKFDKLSGIFPLNGWDVARNLKCSQSFSGKKFSVFYSCDLSDAYTNCSLQDLISAIEVLCSVMSGMIPDWKKDLAVRLAKFVFSCSYVETAGGIWLTGEVLPMGCVASGEALDTIGLAGEVSTLGNISLESRLTGPKYIYGEESLDVDDYNRYRDDTRVVDNKDDMEAIIENMKVLATKVFPPHIKISFEVSVFCGTFLDTMFFRNVSTNSFTTCVRLNLSTPSSVDNASSCAPAIHLFSGFLSNGIRGYRICSEPELYNNWISMLEEELMHAGFGDVSIMDVKNKLRQIIGKMDPATLKAVDDVKIEKLRPPATLFNLSNSRNYCLHSIMKKAYVASGEMKLVSVSGFKTGLQMKGIIYSGRIHQKTVSKLKK
jgi:hypothetical protein